MKFSKQKMIERVTKAGQADMIDEDAMRIMDDLDGQEVSVSCWQRQVMGLPVFWVVGKSGKGNYVNEADCI